MDGVASVTGVSQDNLTTILALALVVALGLCVVLSVLLWRAQRRLTVLRTRRALGDSLPRRLNQRVAKFEKMPVAAPISGASLMKSANMTPPLPEGPLLAKKPRSKRDPILPPDVASDYQNKAKAESA